MKMKKVSWSEDVEKNIKKERRLCSECEVIWTDGQCGQCKSFYCVECLRGNLICGFCYYKSRS